MPTTRNSVKGRKLIFFRGEVVSSRLLRHAGRTILQGWLFALQESSGHFQPVTPCRLRSSNRSGWKLNYRVCNQAGRYAPWWHRTLYLLHLHVAAYVDEIDGKSHANRVYGLAWGNPEPFSRHQAIAPQQAFSAVGTSGGRFGDRSEFFLARDIENLEAHINGRKRRTGLAKYCSRYLPNKTNHVFYLPSSTHSIDLNKSASGFNRVSQTYIYKNSPAVRICCGEQSSSPQDLGSKPPVGIANTAFTREAIMPEGQLANGDR